MHRSGIAGSCGDSLKLLEELLNFSIAAAPFYVTTSIYTKGFPHLYRQPLKKFCTINHPCGCGI